MLAITLGNITAAVTLTFFNKTRLLADPECQDIVTTAGLMMTSFATMLCFLSHAELGTCQGQSCLVQNSLF